MQKKSIALMWAKSTFLSKTDEYPPLGLFYLGAQLEAQGHHCEYFDLNYDPMPKDGEFSQIWLSATSPQMAEIKRIANETAGWTKTRRVLGGAAAWAAPDTVKDLGFDLVVGGEGDHPDSITRTLELADDTKTSYTLYPISKTLDWVIPPIRRWTSKYNAFMKDREGKSHRMGTLFSARGCPMECAFCESGRHGVIWDRLTRYEPVSIVEEQIKQLVDLGHTGLCFYDDIYLLNKKRTLEMLEVQKKYGVVFRCFLRSDIVTKHGEEFFKQMADSGLIEVFCGVESADDQIKRNIHKGTEIWMDEQVLDWCNKYNVRCKMSFILGLPGESMESMEKTRRWVLSHNAARIQVGRLVPFSGTPLTSKPQNYDLTYDEQPPDEWFYAGDNGIDTRSFVSTSHLTRDQIDKFWRKLQGELKAAGIPS